MNDQDVRVSHSGAPPGECVTPRHRGSVMGRLVWMGWGMGVALVCSGCMSGPMLDNPGRVGASASEPCPNPVYLPHGPGAYSDVFERVLDVLGDYQFEI